MNAFTSSLKSFVGITIKAILPQIENLGYNDQEIIDDINAENREDDIIKKNSREKRNKIMEKQREKFEKLKHEKNFNQLTGVKSTEYNLDRSNFKIIINNEMNYEEVDLFDKLNVDDNVVMINYRNYYKINTKDKNS